MPEMKFSKEHVWVKVQGDTAIIGITKHAQEQLADIVFVDMPEPGTKVDHGKPMGSIESVKSVSDLISPVTGEVAENNQLLRDKPELVNESPYDEGWIVKVKVEEMPDLLSKEEYESTLK